MDGKVTVSGNCDIYVGSGILNKLPKIVNLKKYSNIVVITDKLIEGHWLKELEKNLPKDIKKIILPDGEQSKNIEIVQKIWLELFLNGCDRKSLIINLGGGAVSDIGGFAASTYMRGIDFINIPTTLLSQVDASAGGKTGINFAGIKNLIGTFNQPVVVICDINFLSTLPDREFIAGFGEIIKHGLITDKKYFVFTSSKKPRDFSKEELTEIVLNSAKIKAKISSEDEKEQDKRKILNFGHTIGHAIESLSLETNKPLFHGEAVSIGMVVEARISHLMKMFSLTDVQLIIQALVNAGLPISISSFKRDEIIKKLKSDKKNVKGEVNFTLLTGIGSTAINQKVPDNIIEQALI